MALAVTCTFLQGGGRGHVGKGAGLTSDVERGTKAVQHLRSCATKASSGFGGTTKQEAVPHLAIEEVECGFTDETHVHTEVWFGRRVRSGRVPWVDIDDDIENQGGTGLAQNRASSNRCPD